MEGDRDDPGTGTEVDFLSLEVNDDKSIYNLMLMDYGLVCKMINYTFKDKPGVGTTSYIAPEVVISKESPCYETRECKYWNECNSEKWKVC